MISITCNSCQKEIEENVNFIFEGMIVENGPLVPGIEATKGVRKTTIHLCKDCFDKSVKPIVYGNKK